jgi:polyhydroxybutyrate depolymerase
MRALTITAVVLAAAVLVLVVYRCASGQTKIGLGGKDVRVPLQWLTSVPPRAEGLKAADYGREIDHGGLERFYEMHVPSAKAPPEGYPIVLVFHGGGSYPAAVRYESRMDEVSDRGGFIVVYPAGTNRLRFPKDRLLTWNDGRAYKDGRPNKVDDVGYVSALLADLGKFVAIDPRRIYAAGYSNGAQFAIRLIKQLPEPIGAVAVVAGQRGPDEIFPAPRRPISIMQFGGLQDRIGPYKGGSPERKVEFVTLLKPVPEVIQAWAEFDECRNPPAKRTVREAEELTYGPGRDGAEVVLWTLKDGGHTWPGGNVLPAVAEEVGPVNRDVFAAEEMWKFFERHPLDEKYAKEKSAEEGR